MRIGRVPALSAALGTARIEAALRYPVPPGGRPVPQTETITLTAGIAFMPRLSIGPFALALSAQADAAGGVTAAFAVTGRKDFGTYTVTASEALAGTPGLNDITMEADA